MKRNDIKNMSDRDLVSKFASVGEAQYDALLRDNIPLIKNLAYQIRDIDKELRSRGTEARSGLLTLLEHPNIQVRLYAAKCTLAIAPQKARAVIEAISQSSELAQAGSAGMTLWALEEGIFKPD